jgi:hypothetical protein
MVTFESAAGLTAHRLNGKVPNGYRTLLRLHRALHFILEFMRRLSVSSDGASVGAIAAEVYYETLVKHSEDGSIRRLLASQPQRSHRNHVQAVERSRARPAEGGVGGGPTHLRCH